MMMNRSADIVVADIVVDMMTVNTRDDNQRTLRVGGRQMVVFI